MSQTIRKSLFSHYKRKLWSPFFKAISKYQLVNDGDHIAVCISGGKDSMVMAFLFKELLSHQLINFKLTYLVMDPGYHPHHRQQIIENCQQLGLELTIFDTSVFEEAESQKQPCYACARKRRGHLYVKAKELGCNKIALGHHYDDVLETIVMNMFFKGTIETMMPYIESKNYKGMSLIRPMTLILEQDIVSFSQENNLSFLKCACAYSERNELNQGDRMKARQVLKTLSLIDSEIPNRLFHSMSSVNLKKVLQYKFNDEVFNFYDYLEMTSQSGIE